MQLSHPQKTLIIAEAGVNHNGSLERAIEMVEVAKRAGADVVKFQTFKAEDLVTKTAAKANYQNQNDKTTSTQFDMLKALELDNSAHLKLWDHCKQVGITFMSTPFDMESADFLFKLGMETFKIPSGEITNYPLIRKIASFNRPTILSTGMSTLQDIQNAVNVFTQNHFDLNKLTVLHCCSDYPAKMQDINLRAMLTIKQRIGVEVGYSDHSMGIEVATAAVAMGARVIEKHFTLSKTLPGPDHLASLEPSELAAMIKAIRNIEVALGSDEKKPMAVEMETAKVVRKSIVAKKHISKGEKFSDQNLTIKRPGTGMSPFLWDKVLGQTSQREYSPDDLIDQQVT